VTALLLGLVDANILAPIAYSTTTQGFTLTAC
jgi:hypothetical protein